MSSPTAWPQAGTHYRVEVLVLRHLEVSTEPRPVAELPDFSAALDLRARAEGPAEPPAVPEDPFYLGPPNSELPPPVGTFPDQRGRWSNVTLLENRSERMNSVWQNLRLSGEFRPETFLAWEQPAEEPFPELRLHNEEIIRIDDPYAFMRHVQPAYVFHYDVESGAFGMLPIPEPAYHYALDGSVRLRRSRFLHIDLDLTFGTAVPDALQATPGPLRPEYRAYRVHALRQSRQVRTGRMEYFDSPVLGALVWVTEIETNEVGSTE